MKVMITISIDSEVREKLREADNQSALIEKLLKDHFSITQERSVEDIEREIAILELKRRHEQEMEELNASK